MYPEDDAQDSPEDKAPMDDEQKKDEQPENETGLVSKSLFGGKMPEPGSTCTFKVVKVYDDEVEVEYAGTEDAKEPSSDDTMGRMSAFADKE